MKSFPIYSTDVKFLFTGNGSAVYVNESAGLSYVSVTLVVSSLETDLSFSVILGANGTAVEGTTKCVHRSNERPRTRVAYPNEKYGELSEMPRNVLKIISPLRRNT